MSHMKKIGALVGVILLLTACASTPSGDSVETNDTGTITEKVEITDDYADDALPKDMQLVVGSLLLEETGLAVLDKQASDLVPYWKLYISLTESDSTAPEELNALIKEIQVIMTADQINHIAGLQLTQEDMTVLVEELGLSEQNKPEGMEDGANTGQGGPGGGGVPEGGDGTIDPELMATMQAEKELSGDRQSSRMIIPLLEALISLLEGKISS